jgi:hypothetical protein
MTPRTSPSTSPPGLMGSGHAQEASACPSHALPGSLSSQVCARLEPQPLATSVGAALATYAPSAFRPSSSGSLAMLAAMRVTALGGQVVFTGAIWASSRPAFSKFESYQAALSSL